MNVYTIANKHTKKVKQNTNNNNNIYDKYDMSYTCIIYIKYNMPIQKKNTAGTTRDNFPSLGYVNPANTPPVIYPIRVRYLL